ncbi:VWA domain-containing protein [Aliiglaciecola sp. 3_MG-2023]|uniref:vWA domain-containing protein n=1 Tax=Aliiglaciecola sp. 3_MG-2023 TaxID=3062644 RepID=UPI0026E27E1B|nr:VWA domain-containing protein [Aliiglaciecola sp. 3_MG-2023]MDO6691695.1 VWA domain-containing protein [Aliiglaciecola sp. 3_MG-2023]
MIDWNSFHFLRPEWFFGLIPLLLLLVLLMNIHRRQSGWQSVVASHLYQHLIAEKGNRQRRPPLSLVALGWIIAVTALAGPTWERLPQPVFQLSAGKAVVLDMSMSMRATDLKPDRLTRAKYKAIDLINEISEGDVGLVAYAGDAFTISPLSSDAQNLTTLLPSLSPEIMPVAGSEPYLGLKMAADLLKNAGFLEGEIFWITDGVEVSQLAELNSYIESLPYRISILGVGTAQGAPIQLLDGDFLKDNRGAIVVPKMDAQMLSGLARKSGGKFYAISANDSDIQYLTQQSLINRETASNKDDSEQFGDEWQEAGPYLLLLLLPLAAFAFRRGYLTVFVVMLVSSSLVPQPAFAEGWQDWFKNSDQRGLEALQQEQYDQAAKEFASPMWQGAALYKQGNYQAALDAFSQAEGPQALYNQGNALAQLGELDEAIKRYEDVLKLQPEHPEALKNKEILEQLKEQQEQQEQEQQQQQDQQSDDSEHQQSDDQQTEQQDSQNQQSQQDQQSQDQQNQESQQDQQNQEQQQSQNEQDSDQKQQDPQQSDSEQNDSQQNPQSEQQESEQEQDTEQQQTAEQLQQAEESMTDEEREEMQRLQNLLNRVPDDPSFLLKRKMQLENQQRRRQRTPSQSKRNW